MRKSRLQKAEIVASASPNRRKGINSRVKGSSFERLVVKILSDTFQIPYKRHVRRTPNSGALVTRADIWISPSFRDRFPFFCELKNREDLGVESSVYLARVAGILEKARLTLLEDPEYPSTAPVVVIFTRNHYPVYAVMSEAGLTAAFRKEQLQFLLQAASFDLTFMINDKKYRIFLLDDFLKAYSYIETKGIM